VVDTLGSALSDLKSVLSQVEAGDDQGKASGQAEVKDEGGNVKSEGRGVTPSAIDTWQRSIKRGAIGSDGVRITP